MSESHWTFNRGRGGSTRSDGVSFSPALKWDGDLDDPPIRVVGEGEEWCWEVRFPGKTKYRVINPSLEGLYTPREVQAWIDRKYPLADVTVVSREAETVNLNVSAEVTTHYGWLPLGFQASQLAFDWGYDKAQLRLDFPEGGDK